MIALAILLISIVLALTDYSDRRNETEYNQKMEAFEVILSYVFIFEFILKVIAQGFIVHSRSYMRDPWNWLDLIVVITGIVSIIFIGNSTATIVRPLRVLRVLRPLKSIQMFPKMRRLVGALLDSLPNLGNAVLFMLFVFLLFDILGVQWFGGTAYYRCRFRDEPFANGTWPIDEDIEALCSADEEYGF